MNNYHNNKIINNFIAAADEWYESNRNKTGKMDTNTVNVGLIISHMIADGLPISEERLMSREKSQVRGLSGNSIAKILENHGETREFTREGGRTSRKTLPKAQKFAEIINNVDFSGAPTKEISFQLEEYFTKKAQLDFFDKQTINVAIDPKKPASQIISDILLEVSKRSDKPTGVVLQHLVGAKLELRFPDSQIGRDKASTADVQTGREGDFQIKDTAFHVTVSPMEKLMNRCKNNIDQGFRPVVIVPERRVLAAKQLTEVAEISDRVNVIQAESYIGTNIEELATYDSNKIQEGIARLIRRYNQRIEAVELDKSLRISEPAWITKIAKSLNF